VGELTVVENGMERVQGVPKNQLFPAREPKKGLCAPKNAETGPQKLPETFGESPTNGETDNPGPEKLSVKKRVKSGPFKGPELPITKVSEPYTLTKLIPSLRSP